MAKMLSTILSFKFGSQTLIDNLSIVNRLGFKKCRDVISYYYAIFAIFKILFKILFKIYFK